MLFAGVVVVVVNAQAVQRDANTRLPTWRLRFRPAAIPSHRPQT